MKLGLIGVGNIGFHFANRLLEAGHELFINDANPQAVEHSVAKGAQAVSSAKELASVVETVLLCLPIPQIVKEVTTGKGGVINGTSVKTVLDLSTTGPSVTTEVAQLLAEQGIAMIGAPVSGGTVAAEKGTLAVMSAGPREAFEQVEPILKVIGKNIFYLGEDPSLGQTMKIINNTLYATSLIASSEALIYGVKAGLDAETMLSALNVSSGRSFATLERIPQCVLNRSFPVRFTTLLLHKDVKMCIEEAEKLGITMMVPGLVRQLLAFAIAQGDGAKDNASIIQHFEKWAGVQFGSENKT